MRYKKLGLVLVMTLFSVSCGGDVSAPNDQRVVTGIGQTVTVNSANKTEK